MRKVKILATLGILLIIIGLGVQMIQYQHQINIYKKQVNKCEKNTKNEK